MHKITIGSVEITALLDSSILMNPKYFLPEHADQLAAEYADAMDERGLLPMAVTTYLIRSAGKNVLVDTGLGGRKRAGFPHGTLPDAFREAGVDPAEIDAVVHTHLHVDHVGWNTYDPGDGRNEIFFPNAQFHIQQAEWDYWMQPDRLAEPGNAHLRECVEPLRDSARLALTQGEAAFDANITFISTPGHTPGHVAIGIASGGERAVILGDASHHPVQLAHPDWSPSADTDPVLSAKSRDQLFERAIAEDRLVAAGHWEHPGFGRIRRLEGKRVFTAL